MQTSVFRGAVAPTEIVQVSVRKLVEQRGEPQAIAHLRVSRQTLGRLAGGLPVQRATLDVVKLRLGLSVDG